jgi:hypothetical protein
MQRFSNVLKSPASDIGRGAILQEKRKLSEA